MSSTTSAPWGHPQYLTAEPPAAAATNPCMPPGMTPSGRLYARVLVHTHHTGTVPPGVREFVGPLHPTRHTTDYPDLGPDTPTTAVTAFDRFSRFSRHHHLPPRAYAHLTELQRSGPLVQYYVLYQGTQPLADLCRACSCGLRHFNSHCSIV